MDQKKEDMENVMQLDPGPRKRVAASSSSFCLMCILGSVAVAAIFILTFFHMVTSRVLLNVREPHHELYHNASVPGAPVIRPLVHTNTTFDIVATVWVRAPRAEEREFNVRQEGGGEAAEKAYDDVVVLANVPYILEYAIYSGVVFRGLHMHDKHVSAEVNFTFPTARFRDKNYTTGDLRASFALIPSAPSPLEHLVNFSTWIPEEVSYWPIRPWLLPNALSGSPNTSDHLGRQSLTAAAIDSFGATMPLIEVHEIASSCVPRKDMNNTISQIQPRAMDENEDTEMQMGPVSQLFLKEQPHKRHPHVVTRTQLRIVIEENVYNLTAYNEQHEKLKSEACGRKDRSLPGPLRSRCMRSYQSHGPLSTRFEVARPSEAESEWFYAPYLTPLANAAGMLDVVPIPVNRENCSSYNMSTPESSSMLPFIDADSMNVTWRVSFTGRTPTKMMIADMFNGVRVHAAHDASALQKQKAQETAEITNGVFGHRFYEDGYPRMRFLLMTFRVIALYIAPLFTLHYWYTCSSTVGLSIRGQWLTAGEIVVLTFIKATITSTSLTSSNRNAIFMILVIAETATALLRPLLALKALCRVEFGLSGRSPYVRWSKATHRERASARVDARTGWPTIATGTAVLLAVYYVFKPWNHAMLGLFDEATAPPKQRGLQGVLERVVFPAALALRYVAHALQLTMNTRSRTFAGRSRVAVALLVFALLPKYAIHAGLLGPYAVRIGVSWDDALHDMLLLGSAWQALSLPLVDRTAEDEGEK